MMKSPFCSRWPKKASHREPKLPTQQWESRQRYAYAFFAKIA